MQLKSKLRKEQCFHLNCDSWFCHFNFKSLITGDKYGMLVCLFNYYLLYIKLNHIIKSLFNQTTLFHTTLTVGSLILYWVNFVSLF